MANIKSWLVLTPLLILAAPLSAQESGATLRGMVTDPQGASVTGADVAVKNEATGETIEGKTNDKGLFTAPLLKPGSYGVTIQARGFQTLQRTGIHLDMGQVSQINLPLQIGGMSQSVTVTSEAPLLDNVNADRGQVIDSNLGLALPLVNRNLYQVVQLTAGVTFNSSYVWMQPYQQNAMEKVSISGGLNQKNEFVLDGAPNNLYNQNVILAGSNPPIDAVSEFKVQTNAYDPQNGNTSGGVVNITTKNGTNTFHGAVWDFLRRTPWNANSFQNNAAGRVIPTTHIDQYGFEVDGPVYFPKLYDGRNKTFFMASYEKYRQAIPGGSTQSVPEPEMINGDFSKLTNAAGQLIAVNDPLSGYTNNSGTWMRNPFPANIIPANRLNPITKKIMSYFPQPNQRSATGNYSDSDLFLSGGTFGQTDRFYDYILRGDHNFTDKQRIFARYHDSMRNQFQLGNGIQSGPGMTGNDSIFSPVSGGLDYVYTINATTVFNARGSYSYYHYHQSPMDNAGFDKAALGFSPADLSMIAGPPTFGVYSFSGYMNLGQNEYGYRNHNKTFESSISKVYRNHTFKGGVDLRNIQFGMTPQGCPLCISFDANFTRVNYLDTRDNLTGNSIASALLGYPSSGNTQNVTLGMFSRKYYAFYGGDDWRINRKLTVNLGLRYNVYVPFSERYNRVNSGFDSTVTNPVDQMINRAQFPNVPTLKGALLFAGVNGQPTTAVQTFKGGIEPRFGFAYQLNSRLVMRGGFGISHYDTYGDMYTSMGFDTVSTNLVTSPDSGKTPVVGVLNNLFPTGVGSPAPIGPLTYMGRGFSVFQANYDTPYVKQFSVSLQAVLPLNSIVEVTYQGSRGMDYRMGTGINEPSLSLRQQCDALEGGNSAICDAQVANPFYGLSPFAGQSRGSNATQSLWEMSRPMPEFGGITNNSSNQSKTWYNSAQVTYETRSWKGLNARAAYTFSKFIEQYGWADLQRKIPQRGLINVSVPNSFKAMGSYDLPFGPNKLLFTSSNPIVKRIVSGWQWNMVWNWNSGFPMDNNSSLISLANAAAGSPDYGGSGQFVRVFSPCAVTYSNAAGSPPAFISHGTAVDQQFGCTVNSAVWGVKPKYAPDNMLSSRNSAFHKPPLWQVDMSINKTTHINEKVSLQFRAEAQNVFNHYSFYGANPSTNPTDPNFGLINKNTVADTNSTLPRQIQLGAKVVW